MLQQWFKNLKIETEIKVAKHMETIKKEMTPKSDFNDAISNTTTLIDSKFDPEFQEVNES